MSYQYRTLNIRALNERLRELLNAKEAKVDAETELENARANSSGRTLAKAQEAHDLAADAFSDVEAEELEKLESLRDEIGNKGDLIDDSNGPFVMDADFADYARELAEDIGAIDRNAGWPLGCIDWDRAADALKMDYSTVDWEGDTYWYRS